MFMKIWFMVLLSILANCNYINGQENNMDRQLRKRLGEFPPAATLSTFELDDEIIYLVSIGHFDGAGRIEKGRNDIIIYYKVIREKNLPSTASFEETYLLHYSSKDKKLYHQIIGSKHRDIHYYKENNEKGDWEFVGYLTDDTLWAKIFEYYLINKDTLTNSYSYIANEIWDYYAGIPTYERQFSMYYFSDNGTYVSYYGYSGGVFIWTVHKGFYVVENNIIKLEPKSSTNFYPDNYYGIGTPRSLIIEIIEINEEHVKIKYSNDDYIITLDRYSEDKINNDNDLKNKFYYIMKEIIF